jgi:[ribosomal protein S18]-alanine N-acetyltransferase
MTTRTPLMSAEAPLRVRPAVPADHERLSTLMYHEIHVHRHLDWRAPLDWLGYEPYWVIEQGERLAAALACPADPASIAWIRLFVFSSSLSGRAAWQPLWDSARRQLQQAGGATAAAIATQRWLDPILIEAGFEPAEQIVLLEWNAEPRRRVELPTPIGIRPMRAEDLPAVVEADAAAFDPLWRNSLEALTKAYGQASYATVAEEGTALIGYQLSTSSAFGTHLARLAVRPAAQRRGVGAALVNDLILHMPEGSEPRLTVNTQANNAASLALYYRLGFRRTGERYPVYSFQVP